MLVIKNRDNTYWHNKGRIITFDSIDEANLFIQLFQDYATKRLLIEHRVFEVMKVGELISTIQIVNENITSKTVTAKELLERIH